MARTTFPVAIGIAIALSAALSTAGEREALVIGNSKYAGNAVLGNPGNDADAITAALKELGFTVITKKDSSLSQMNDALVAFRRMLSKGGLGLFFYAGHGVQVRGENYLVPVGARMEEEFQVKYECLEVARVLDAMDESQSNLKVVVLDCCRDNPFQRSWRRGSATKGLAAPSHVPRGTMIAFSTSPNETAADGRGGNSPYTEQLVTVLRSRPAEGLELSEVFREASRAVYRQTQQVPWMNLDATMDKYYLWKAAASSTSTRPHPQPVFPAEKSKQVEVRFLVRDGGENGPELTEADVSLRWLASENAAPAVLGRAKSDHAGRAKISADLSGTQLAGGSFEVLITSGDASKTWVLPNFPRSLEWDVWLPRRVSGTSVARLDRPASKASRSREITNSIGMKLVLIPAGEFMMGSPDSEADRGFNEGPQHRVRITKPFYLGQCEVTQREYEEVMGTNPSRFREVSGQDTSRFPVEQVSWDNAVEFCRKLTQKEGRAYRLPTEAEWEYACRGGTTTPFSFGSVLNGRQANCDAEVPYGTSDLGPYLRRTTTVGAYRPNAFGLYDMHGNVWEWCADWYEARFYAESPQDDPTGPSRGLDRARRGGSWVDFARHCRSAHRRGYPPGSRLIYLGFRVAQAAAD